MLHTPHRPAGFTPAGCWPESPVPPRIPPRKEKVGDCGLPTFLGEGHYPAASTEGFPCTVRSCGHRYMLRKPQSWERRPTMKMTFWILGCPPLPDTLALSTEPPPFYGPPHCPFPGFQAKTNVGSPWVLLRAIFSWCHNRYL